MFMFEVRNKINNVVLAFLDVDEFEKCLIKRTMPIDKIVMDLIDIAASFSDDKLISESIVNKYVFKPYSEDFILDLTKIISKDYTKIPKALSKINNTEKYVLKTYDSQDDVVYYPIDDDKHFEEFRRTKDECSTASKQVFDLLMESRAVVENGIEELNKLYEQKTELEQKVDK